jgi:hypothetical protein
MHQPRNFDPLTDSSSRYRAPCAVGGNGEASAPVAADVPAAGGAALDLLFEKSRILANRVREGELPFLDAVDMAYSAAEFAGLVGRYGDDLVQVTLALAFMDIPRKSAC